MTGYTKLFSTILGSTIWGEDDATRLVWITMLALADRNGVVEASVPGLAAFARQPLPSTEKALAILSSPDTYSRTKDHDGRRIKEVDGGWVILNHAKYRQKMRSEERTEYLRIKQQESRARKMDVNHASTRSTEVNPYQPIAEAEAEAGGVQRVNSHVPEARHEAPPENGGQGENKKTKSILDLKDQSTACEEIINTVRQARENGNAKPEDIALLREAKDRLKELKREIMRR